MSVNSDEHLKRIQGQYTALTNRFLARWDGAADDILQQRYGPARLISDIFGFWADVGFGVSLAMDVLKGDFPTVRFLLKTTDTTATQSVVLPHTTDATIPLAATDVVPVGGVQGPKILAKQIVPTFVDLGDGLQVKLTDLDKIGLVEGDYSGKVLDGNQQPIARIFVRVTK